MKLKKKWESIGLHNRVRIFLYGLFFAIMTIAIGISVSSSEMSPGERVVSLCVLFLTVVHFVYHMIGTKCQ